GAARRDRGRRRRRCGHRTRPSGHRRLVAGERPPGVLPRLQCSRGRRRSRGRAGTDPVSHGLDAREQGLERVLSTRLLGMIAIGQSVGVGLFLGSGLSVKMAGPAVILSYVIGAAITFPVMRALAEMTAAHPMAGSFGAWAEHYVSPLAGWVTRYTYCMAQMV